MAFFSDSICKLVYSYFQNYELVVYSCITKNAMIHELVAHNSRDTHIAKYLYDCATFGWKDGMLLIWICYFGKQNFILDNCLTHLVVAGQTQILKDIKHLIKTPIEYRYLLFKAAENERISTMRLLRKWGKKECVYIMGMVQDLPYYTISINSIASTREVVKWMNKYERSHESIGRIKIDLIIRTAARGDIKIIDILIDWSSLTYEDLMDMIETCVITGCHRDHIDFVVHCLSKYKQPGHNQKNKTCALFCTAMIEGLVNDLESLAGIDYYKHFESHLRVAAMIYNKAKDNCDCIDSILDPKILARYPRISVGNY